ncbi:MAG: putative lipid II flippase FtsW [Planctomycetota bacterium]
MERLEADGRTFQAATLDRDLFLSSVMLLVAAGTVLIFSASAFYRSATETPWLYFHRQLLWIPIGATAAALFANLEPRVLRRFSAVPLAAALALLAIVLVPQVGRDVNAARRWLPLGGLQFQPSELAKLAVVLFLGGFLAGGRDRARRFFRGFVPASAAVLPVFLLILVEPDLGTAIFVLALALCVLFLGGVPLSYFLASAVFFAPLTAFLAARRWDAIRSRFLGFLEPENLYQVRQSLIALGSGGIGGLGLGAGRQKFRFLPEPHTDFIFAIAGEELGYVGSLAILALFLVLLWSGVRMVRRFRDRFSFLVGSGIVIALAAQAAANVAVVTASAPTKGMALPFVSFGGSGLVVMLAEVGILLSLEREHRLGLAGAPAEEAA